MLSHLSVQNIDREIIYRGEELRPHYLLTEFGIKGTAIVAFAGPCRVSPEALVDWEDRMAGSRIESRRMLHFLGEFFGMTLREAVIWQRLSIAMAAEKLSERLGGRARVMRRGDDLFVDRGQEEAKLSVSIVTSSPVSQLMHFGINIDPTGAPVKAIGLEALDIEPRALADELLEGFYEEWKKAQWACAKVRPVV